MKTLDVTKLVRDIALEDPRIRKVLESLGIDTCCGGGRPLAEAARDAGIEPGTLLDRLRAATLVDPDEQKETRDWRSASLAELTDHIESTHHVFLWNNLPAIAKLFDKVLRAHGEAHGEMLRGLHTTFNELRTEIEAHLTKEEQVLFPYLRTMSAALEAGKKLQPMHCGSVGNPIRQMEHEHENAGAALASMRRCTSDYALPADACPTFTTLFESLRELESDLHEHIFLENNILFLKAVRMEGESIANGNEKGGRP